MYNYDYTKKYAILGIVKENGVTVGAVAWDGERKISLNREDIMHAYYQGVKFENAIVTSEGYVKGKHGIKLQVANTKSKENVNDVNEESKSGKIGTNVFKCSIKKNDCSFYTKTNEIILLHGSKSIIPQPVYGAGEEYNDYGKGFYCISPESEENIRLAKEWACSIFNNTKTGYVNKYKLNLDDLKILNLNMYNILVWTAITANHRNLSTNQEILQKLKEKYYIDPKGYDCVYGWRCDDTYSNIVRDFIGNNITDEAVDKAIMLGNLKNQFVLISEKAFNQVSCIGYEEVKPFDKYRRDFERRKSKADMSVNRIKIENKARGSVLAELL